MIKIYHADVPRLHNIVDNLLGGHMMNDPATVVRAWGRGFYTLMAEVDTDDPYLALALTTIDHPSWSVRRDPRVTLRANLPSDKFTGKLKGFRPSTTGDVIVTPTAGYIVSAERLTALDHPPEQPVKDGLDHLRKRLGLPAETYRYDKENVAFFSGAYLAFSLIVQARGDGTVAVTPDHVAALGKELHAFGISRWPLTETRKSLT